MEMPKKRKPRTVSPQKRAEAIDKKIAVLEAKIADLKAEKEEILKPIKTQAALKEAMSKMSLEEIAERLGVEI